MIALKLAPSWAIGCDDCEYGLRPNGDYCTCEAGRKRKAGDEERSRRLNGLGKHRALPLDAIPAAYRSMTGRGVLRKWRANGYREKVTAFLSAFEWYKNTVKSGAEGTPFLMLAGPVGSGKTTIAMMLARGALLGGIPTEIVAYYDWLNRIAAAGYNDAAAIIEQAKIANVFVLDDLGSMERARDGMLEPETPRRIEILRQAIDYRLAGSLPTIITTNFSQEQIGAQFGELLQSRLCGTLTHNVFVGGVDLRGVQI